MKSVLFSDNRDFVSNQVIELKNIIDCFRTLFGSNTKYSLMGHSKCGLVAISYATSYTDIINTILTFGTPYNVEIYNDLADNFFTG